MAVRMLRSCFQSILKLVNSVNGMVGMSMILYGLWMFMVWNKHHGGGDDNLLPWFIYTFLGVGAIFFVVTCWGHIAAETSNGCCLYFYLVFVVLLMMLEGAVTIDVILNQKWEEDFPEEITGNLNNLKDFIRENFEFCKWVGLFFIAVQGLCILLALTLKALGPFRDRYYESDDELYTPEGVPLLRNYAPPPFAVGGPAYISHKNGSWKV